MLKVMPDLGPMLQNGTLHAWVYIPFAVLLGALHGLEPGHSKTMMAAFIIAVRGTIAQAVLLGLSAAISHSLLIWIMASIGLIFGGQFDMGHTEPWFQLVSALIIIGMALWMFLRARRDLIAAEAHYRHGHDHEHHHHDHEVAHLDHHDHGEPHAHDHHYEAHGEYQDAHEREHAEEIERRFAGRSVTTPQIILFGITGGLMPCPSALSVLIICLQLRQVVLGFSLVLAFSVGLAATMVGVGAAAAWSLRHAEKRFQGFGDFARRAPFFSAVTLGLIALIMAVQAMVTLSHQQG